MKPFTIEDIEHWKILIKHILSQIHAKNQVHYDLDDLMQVGLLAAWSAKQKFNDQHDSNASFVTYAFQRVKGAILDEIRDQDWRPRSVLDKKLPNIYTVYSMNETTDDFNPVRIPYFTDFDSRLMCEHAYNLLDSSEKQFFTLAINEFRDFEIAKIIKKSKAWAGKLRRRVCLKTKECFH